MLNLVKKLLAWTLIILIVLMLLLRLSVPYAIQHGVSDLFQQYGVSASIGDVDLGLIDGELSLIAMSAHKEGEQQMALQRLTLRWSWTDLMDEHARLVSLYIDGLELIASERDGVLTIAGLSPAETADEPVNEETSDAAPPQWLVSVGDVRLQHTRLCYASASDDRIDHCVDSDLIDWSGDVYLDLAAMDGTTLPLIIDGRLQLDGFALQDNRLERSPLSFASLVLDDISIDTLQNITLSAIRLDQLALLQRASDDPASHITSLGAMAIDKVVLEDMSTLSIDSISLADHRLFVLKRDDTSLEFSDWIPATSGTESPEETPAASEPAEPFVFRLGRFEYQSEAGITYVDDSLPETFTARLSAIALSVSDIDTSDKTGSSAISYQAVFDEHGTIALDGDATLFADKKTIAIDGDIKGLDLREISAFTKGTIGYSIKSGQLDSDISLRADDNILDSKLVLNLHQFELKALSKEDEEKMDSSMGLPLSSSLALLRDSDNSIRLEIPITGDVDAPDFDPGDAINKALSKAITFAVINYYTPFGLVMAADGLLSLATGLEFDPVTFGPGAATIDDPAGQQLDNTLALLTQRPGIRLTLCGFSAAPDAAELVKDLKPSTDGKPSELTAAQQAPLLELAEQRAAAIKQYLVEREVAADRLILCAPEHDAAAETGRVDISI